MVSIKNCNNTAFKKKYVNKGLMSSDEGESYDLQQDLASVGQAMFDWVRTRTTKLASAEPLATTSDDSNFRPLVRSQSNLSMSENRRQASRNLLTVCSYPFCNQSVSTALKYQKRPEQMTSFLQSSIGSLTSRQHNFYCPKCGGLYCNSHAGDPRLAAKLDASGNNWDSVDGVWTRVCQLCFISRPEYQQSRGVSRSLTHLFREARGRNLQRIQVERHRLEKRLEKVIVEWRLLQYSFSFLLGHQLILSLLMITPRLLFHGGEMKRC